MKIEIIDDQCVLLFSCLAADVSSLYSGRLIRRRDDGGCGQAANET